MINYNRLGYEIKRDLANFSEKFQMDWNDHKANFFYRWFMVF